ncbi:hypothetical protein LIER_08853 [Lithospermum erythrorhizon]|uniref:Oxidoreductase-like domain-containing protein n=1 Tax=Lithospermum erythrorhizon TaxID=34254 RepID=A0AAV3PGD9_LITER
MLIEISQHNTFLLILFFMDKVLKHIHIPPPLFTNQSLQGIILQQPIRTNNHQKLLCIKNITMADQENKGAQALDIGKNSEKPETKLNEKPPPPEKPLPDDCCGSGCVRCVWDVYYDDLEDYNKLYGTDKPDSKTL